MSDYRDKEITIVLPDRLNGFGLQSIDAAHDYCGDIRSPELSDVFDYPAEPTIQSIRRPWVETGRDAQVRYQRWMISSKARGVMARNPRAETGLTHGGRRGCQFMSGIVPSADIPSQRQNRTCGLLPQQKHLVRWGRS